MKRVWLLLSCVRYREVLILQGAPVMGGILAMGQPTAQKGIIGAVFDLANFCLVAHMWSFNDWADRHADEADGRKALQSFTRKGVAPAALLGLSLSLMVAGLSLFSMLGATTFRIAAAITVLGFVYSLPGLHAKSIVLLSSLLHLAGGFLHFLLGYSLFAPIDADAMRIAVVFALVFTAGHGVQEVQDHDADRRAGVQTNAVAFGKSAVFGATLAAFLFVYGYLSLLTASGVIPLWLGPLCLVLGALHLFLARQTLRAGLSFQCIRRYRARYRALFAVLGLSLGFSVFMSHHGTSQSSDQLRHRVQGIDKGQILAERVAW